MKETRISILSFQMCLTAMTITSIGLVTPRLTEDFSLSASEQGILVSMQYIGSTLACFIGGMFCEKYGSGFIGRVSLAIGFAAMICFSFVQSYPMALICVFSLGAFSLSLQNSITSSALAIEGRGHRANAVVQTVFPVGAILVPLLFLLFSFWQRWRPVYLVLAALILIALLFSRGTREKTASVGIIHSLKKFPKYVTKVRYMLGAAVLFLYVAAEIGFWSLTPTLFESTGAGHVSGIISACLIWTMMLAGRILGTVLLKRFSMIPILIPFGILGIVSYLLVMFTSGTIAIVCTALVGLACAPFYASIISWATIIANDKSSSYLAFIMASGSFGAVFLGWVVSLLGDAIAGKLIVLPALCCFTIMILMLCIFGLRREKNCKLNHD